MIRKRKGLFTQSLFLYKFKNTPTFLLVFIRIGHPQIVQPLFILILIIQRNAHLAYSQWAIRFFHLDTTQQQESYETCLKIQTIGIHSHMAKLANKAMDSLKMRLISHPLPTGLAFPKTLQIIYLSVFVFSKFLLKATI